MIPNIKGLDKNIVPEKSKHKVSARSNMVTIKLRKAEVYLSRAVQQAISMSTQGAQSTTSICVCVFRATTAPTIEQT